MSDDARGFPSHDERINTFLHIERLNLRNSDVNLWYSLPCPSAFSFVIVMILLIVNTFIVVSETYNMLVSSFAWSDSEQYVRLKPCLRKSLIRGRRAQR